jgi:RNA recognition motif-containing protein
VEFETPEEAGAAIQQLNHTELDGRQIFVREDREDYELKDTTVAGHEKGGVEGSSTPGGGTFRQREPKRPRS